MNITDRRNDDGSVSIVLAGELDMATADLVDQHVRHVLDGAPPEMLIIDVADLDFLTTGAAPPQH
jgi:anti-anti-sigma regulatory factor